MNKPALILIATLFLSTWLSADDLVAANRVGGYFAGPHTRPPVFLNERSVQYQHRINADLLYPRGEFVPRGQLKRHPPQNIIQGYPNYYH